MNNLNQYSPDQTFEDWNGFMESWEPFIRELLMPVIHQETKEGRKPINLLLSDMRSSLKWARFAECVTIFSKLVTIVIEFHTKYPRK